MTASIFSGIHDFFQSATWSVVQTLGSVFLVVLWVATVFWVRKDAKHRIESPGLIWISTALGAVPPFIGPLIYMLFRPPEYLEDVRERDLEIKAIEQRLGAGACPVCGAVVQPEFLVCPVCVTRLRKSCSTCRRPLERNWQVCPYCETAIGGVVVVEPAKGAERFADPNVVDETVELRPRTPVRRRSGNPG